jgi:hypothetical protein
MLGVSIAACGGGHADRTADTPTDTAQEQVVGGVRIPPIPATLTDDHDRLAYLLKHFWDNLDFRDTMMVNNPNYFEQAFADYQTLFQPADSAMIADGVATLLKSAQVDSNAYDRVLHVAEKYLYDPNSPMRNEDNYAYFLRAVIASDYTSEAEKIRPRDQLHHIAINRPGMLATDFRYIDRNGKTSTLLKTEANRLLVVFYDPDCEECKQILSEMFVNDNLNASLAAGRITVLAICIADNRSGWQETLSKFPSTWLVGYDLSHIEDRELYHFPATPTFYLLDADKRIILKDPPVNQLQF